MDTDRTMGEKGRADLIVGTPPKFLKKYFKAQDELLKFANMKHKIKTGIEGLRKLNELDRLKVKRDIALCEGRLEYLKSLDNEGGEKC